MPKRVTIEFTNRCNRACLGCPRNKMTYPIGDMSLSLLNKIVEQLVYSEGAYWGDKKKYKFRSKIDSFDQNIDVTTDKGRLVKSNFTLMINGFLIPEEYDDLITTQKTYTKQQIVLGVETVVSGEDLK